ncbi:histidine phosphatase family protein [Marinilactibacillus kalidii]|uniref:histidine phosphatase family protein n=1 Tax=Marinilactibacillus kalidii TaxID=2820274 RepID=UPI001ABDAC00|nr:histidine phosphatase family protein [Marinilactibacillus kalidii]
MKKIITIQHTESVHHTNGMIGSWTDWDLTEKGRKDADQIARVLTDEFDLSEYKLYASDLKRAVQTAEALAALVDLEIERDIRIRERDLGEACGKSVKWLKENIVKHEKTIDDRIFPSAESQRDSWERLRPFYKQIMEEGCAIIVAHGDILKQFHLMMLGYEIDHLEQLTFYGKAGGVSEFTITSEGKMIVHKMNDASYKKA